MTVPLAVHGELRDNRGQPVRPGDTVRVDGLAEPAEVHVTDPRYGVLVVLVAGRIGKMGRMVHAGEVQRIG